MEVIIPIRSNGKIHMLDHIGIPICMHKRKICLENYEMRSMNSAILIDEKTWEYWNICKNCKIQLGRKGF